MPNEDIGDAQDTQDTIAEPGSERPDWLPENFTSPEALVRSYKEAQRALTELREENARREEAIADLGAQIEELRSQLDSRASAPPSQPTSPLEGVDLTFDPLYRAFEEAYMEGDPQKLYLLTRFMQQQAVQQAPQQPSEPALDSELEARLIERFVADEVGPGWEEVKPLVARMMKEYPHLEPKDEWSAADTVKHLTMLARVAPSLYGEESAGSERKGAQDEADQAKRIAQTLRAAGIATQSVTTDDARKQAWQRIKDADIGTWADIMQRTERTS